MEKTHLVACLLAISATLVTALYSNKRTKRLFDRNVCFDGIGCFNNSYPFDNADGVLPDPPASIRTQFLLLTRQNQIPDPLFYNDSLSVKISHFEPGNDVIFLVHGFAQSGSAEWVKPMADALLERYNFNVIVVDWGPGARFPHYMQATANARLVGRQLGMLIQRLTEVGSSTSVTHIVGHSLGAHIAGYAASELDTKLGQIAGLDPADPLFEGKDPLVRLDPSDAEFVGVLHTNGEPMYLGGYGMIDEIGHADFYVNGGQLQPGCSKSFNDMVSDLLSGDVGDVVNSISCSHGRAHDIYLESIKSLDCIFLAYPCNNTDEFNAGRCLSCDDNTCAKLGYNVNITQSRGKYFLKTRSNRPFCGLHYGVKIATAAGGDTKGQLILTFHGVDGNSSDPIQLFSEDASLRQGHPHEYVAVVNHEVDDIAEIEVLYKMHTSWIVWTNGYEHWMPENIEITPGGKLNRGTKLFCLKGVSVRNNVPSRFKYEDFRC